MAGRMKVLRGNEPWTYAPIPRSLFLLVVRPRLKVDVEFVFLRRLYA